MTKKDNTPLDQIVGDDSKLVIIGVDPSSGDDTTVIGTLWQDENGKLHGTGLAKMMLASDALSAGYIKASIAKDVSPLSVFYSRIRRNSFVRVELKNEKLG